MLTEKRAYYPFTIFIWTTHQQSTQSLSDPDIRHTYVIMEFSFYNEGRVAESRILSLRMCRNRSEFAYLHCVCADTDIILLLVTNLTALLIGLSDPENL